MKVTEQKAGLIKLQLETFIASLLMEESFGVPQNVKVTITDENERGWSARYRADLAEKECHVINGVIRYNKSEGTLYITFMEETV
jgi:hypothetical protein